MNDEEETKKEILKKILSREAFERLKRVSIVKPDLAEQLEIYLIQLYQTGKIKFVTDEQMKMLLETLSSGKRFRIIK
jgi:programmed cell death protein 5